MKKGLLILLIILQIIGGAVVFFLTLSESLWTALLSLLSTALGLVVPLILLDCVMQTEDLSSDIDVLKNRLHQLEEQLQKPEERAVFGASEKAPRLQPAMTAHSRWTCVKCGAVNREGSSRCESCGARFSYEQESVADAPLTRWKLKNKKPKINKG